MLKNNFKVLSFVFFVMAFVDSLCAMDADPANLTKSLLGGRGRAASSSAASSTADKRAVPSERRSSVGGYTAPSLVTDADSAYAGVGRARAPAPASADPAFASFVYDLLERGDVIGALSTLGRLRSSTIRCDESTKALTAQNIEAHLQALVEVFVTRVTTRATNSRVFDQLARNFIAFAILYRVHPISCVWFYDNFNENDATINQTALVKLFIEGAQKYAAKRRNFLEVEQARGVAGIPSALEILYAAISDVYVPVTLSIVDMPSGVMTRGFSLDTDEDSDDGSDKGDTFAMSVYNESAEMEQVISLYLSFPSSDQVDNLQEVIALGMLRILEERNPRTVLRLINFLLVNPNLTNTSWVDRIPGGITKLMSGGDLGEDVISCFYSAASVFEGNQQFSLEVARKLQEIDLACAFGIRPFVPSALQILSAAMPPLICRQAAITEGQAHISVGITEADDDYHVLSSSADSSPARPVIHSASSTAYGVVGARSVQMSPRRERRIAAELLANYVAIMNGVGPVPTVALPAPAPAPAPADDGERTADAPSPRVNATPAATDAVVPPTGNSCCAIL